jgi:probable O-glycosylation ligase (exosortase A-associated)
MKQLLFMIAATTAGTVGVYAISPFLGVFVYYMFAVLRPQYMWEWSLPPDVNWSYYVALATIGAVVIGHHSGTSVEETEGARRPRFSLAHWTVLVFGIWVGITYLTARNHDAAYLALIEYLKIFIMFTVSTFLIRTTRQVWALFVMTALALGYICYEINYLYLTSGDLRIFKYGYGGLDNNGAGLMLAMGVPMCWFCYQGMRRWYRWLFIALVPVMVHAVLMTYSRGAMVSLLLMCPALLLRSRNRVWVSVVFAGFFLVLIPIMAGPEIRARFLTIEEHEIDESANSRRAAWKAAWKMAVENPIFGVGLRNSPIYSYQYGADSEGRVIHSQYFQIAADNGFVGLGLYLCVLGTAWGSLRHCRRQFLGRTDPEGLRMLALVNGIECSLIAYCVGACFLSLETCELPYLLILLTAQLGVLAGGLEGGGQDDSACLPVYDQEACLVSQ